LVPKSFKFCTVRFTTFYGLQTITLHLLYEREDHVQFNKQQTAMSIPCQFVLFTYLSQCYTK